MKAKNIKAKKKNAEHFSIFYEMHLVNFFTKYISIKNLLCVFDGN